MRKSIKMIAVTGAAVIGIATVGVGWAWFTENATANAINGQGGDLAAVTVSTATYGYDNATQTNPGALFPGHSADVVITVTNPNSVPVKVSDVVPAATNPKAATGQTPVQCVGANFAMSGDPTFTTNQAGNIIPAGGSAVITMEDAITLDGPGTGNECQGMTFTTNWTVSVENQ